MSKDIFAHRKLRRFVRVGFELLDRPAVVVVLTDIVFWAKNAEALNQWCNDHGVTTAGMTVEFYDEKDLLLFCLRWS